MHNPRRGAPGDLRTLDQTSTTHRERHRSLMRTDQAACRSVVVRWPRRYRWKRQTATLAQTCDPFRNAASWAAFPLLSFSLHYESFRCLGLAMKDRELEKMKLDDLWDLHQRIIDVLDRKLETEKRKLQDQLDELGRKFGGSPKDIPQRRPYPKVEPKFRNPNDPSETWSGRGKTPRWMIEMIADGRSIDDFRIQ